MPEPSLPPDLVEARRTPLFDFSTLPTPLAESHRTTVWAAIVVQAGSVRYVDLDAAADRNLGLGPGDTAVIEPGVEHQVEPSTDALFYIQFYRRPAAPLVPGAAAAVEVEHRRSGPWEQRGTGLRHRRHRGPPPDP